MPKLTKRQKRAFGPDPIDSCGSALLSISSLFEAVSKANFQLQKQGQYFEQFMGMKGISPNEEGTGRVSFGDIKKISMGFICKGRKKEYSENLKAMVTKFLALFYGVPVQFKELDLKIVKNGIQSKQKNLLYAVSKTSQGQLDALQILDILTEAKAQQQNLIAFIENQIHEDGSPVYGRACGDGVAVIDFSLKQNRETLIQTLIHESLHTFGFDHCVAWRCLMNPYVEEELWLCPCCLRKYFSERNISLQQFSQRMLSLCEQFELKAMKKCKKINHSLQQLQERRQKP